MDGWSIPTCSLLYTLRDSEQSGLMELSLSFAGGWSRWTLNVPSNKIILWFYDSILLI